MENASKALLMAGGILIALLILGALIMMFTNLQSYQNSNDARTKNTQIAEFNNQFEPYNKEGLTLMELKSVYNKIESNNAQKSVDSNGNIDKNSGYYIEHNINEALLKTKAGLTDGDYQKFLTATGFRTIDDAKKQNLKFKCMSDKIEYKNLDSRISKMYFDIMSN